MAYNYNQQQGPFWDFVHGLNTNSNNNNSGAGVDHQANAAPLGTSPFSFFGPPPGAPGSHPHHPPHEGGFPFGPGGFPGHFGHRRFGGRGCRGRCNRREGSHERTPSHDHDGPSDGEHAEGEAREGPSNNHEGPHTHGHGPHAHGGPHARGGRHGHHGRRGGWGGPRGAHGPIPGFGAEGFDLSALIESLSAHPIAQAFRTYTEQNAARSGSIVVPEADENTFIPPIDVFTTSSAYILHVALPGAKKEDVGVNWDAEKGVLNLAGVVYRHGDEEFLKSLSQSERKVGVFERTIKLPPGNEEKEEVDGDAISAKLDDGVLVVTVPKLEKEWTEVKRVDIE